MSLFERGPIQCEACRDSGTFRGERCGCGPGVRHVADCGRPPRPCPECRKVVPRNYTTPDWLMAWCQRVDTWHEQAFPEDDLKDFGLGLCEEAGEMARAILKDGHGENDRRSHIDWAAERDKEFVDIMVYMGRYIAQRGWNREDLSKILNENLDRIIQRWEEAQAKKKVPPAEPDPIADLIAQANATLEGEDLKWVIAALEVVQEVPS